MLTDSAVTLARRIAAGELSSREAVEAHITQVERANPLVHAVVATRYAEARAEADAADALVASGADPLPPLLGVPCTVKENFELTGMPNTSGLVSRRGVVAERDAPAVARLRAAGAIPLGVTNVSELCMWYESDNRVYGRTDNPYDPTRTVGGSSGGEGAAVACGMAPFGLGSDVGGSIRMPAFFNGVFGHKPSSGLVPNEGQYPMPENEANRYDCAGPLARRAEDLLPVLRVLAAAGADRLPDPSSVDVAALQVVTIEGDGRNRVRPELVAAQRRAVASLRELGATVRPAQLDALRRAADIWSAMLSEASDTPFRTLLAAGARFSAPREVARYVVRRSPHTLPALGLALVERGPELLVRRRRKLVALGRALREEVGGLLGERGVLFYPSFPTLAPRHGAPLRSPFRFAYTAILNVLELPVTQVPLGLDPSGLPLGVQVAAAHGNDHVTIAMAQHLERVFGGWVPPPLAFRGVREGAGSIRR